MSESSPSLGCSGSARLIFSRARARAELLYEPQYRARLGLDKEEPELELGSSSNPSSAHIQTQIFDLFLGQLVKSAQYSSLCLISPTLGGSLNDWV
jgi:hypothetical protein